MASKESTELSVPTQSEYLPARTRELDGESWLDVVRDNIGDDSIDRFSLNRLRVPAGGGSAWEVANIFGETDMVQEFRGIVVHWAPNRMYWVDEYTGEGVPPSCTSSDGRIGVGDPGGDCRTCQFNVYGTAAKGSGKACKEVRATFVLAPDSVFPYYLSAPPTSLKGFKNFMVSLASKGITYWKCEIGLKLEVVPGPNGKYSKIVSRVIRQLDEEEIVNIAKYRDELRPALDENVVIDTVVIQDDED